MDNKLNISITGASGLLGTYMAKSFIEKGHVVKGHRNKSAIPSELIDENIEWVQGDIREQFVVTELLKGCDILIHCAAMVSFEKKQFDSMMSINVDGTKMVVDNMISKNIKLIHISSIAALGRVDNCKPIDEKVLFNPDVKNSAYAESKYESELEVYRGIAEGLDAMILSPSVILGKNQRNTSSSTLWDQILKMPKFSPKGANGFVDVRDVVQAAENCLQNWNSGEKYILNGHNLSYFDLYNKVIEFKNIKVKSVKISPSILYILLPFAKFFFFLTRTHSKISREAIMSTSMSYAYDNNKSINELGVNYTSIDSSLKHSL